MISKLNLTMATLIIFLLSPSFLSCAVSLKASSESEVAATVQNETKNKVIMDVYNYVKVKRMTMLDDRCLSYDFEDSAPSYYSVTIRETNRHGVCVSDADVSAVLFNFHIDKKSWQMSTDAYNSDSGFHPVK